MMMKYFNLFFVLTFSLNIYAQNTNYNIWNPASGTYAVEGQAWPGQGKDFYDRLPARAENLVRQRVWELSKNTAGISIRFTSNAKEIIVRYQVAGSLQMPHFSATGVSGVDLFAKEPGKSDWLWAVANFKFADTIQYVYTNLQRAGAAVTRDYTLFLPLYNEVKWLEVLTPKESNLVPVVPRKVKPIVVYGTSIAQGGCASRSGMSFTNIVQRRLNVPVVNLAFSGNGRLEQPLLDLMTEIDPQIYVLDCLPNLSAEGLAPKIRNAVKTLRSKRPTVPILLVEHCGYMNEEMNEATRNAYKANNRVNKLVYDSLIKGGAKNLYYLSKEEIGLDINSTVDNVHPTDVGMLKYADAYIKKLTGITNAMRK